ncbi:MAG: hypothetical protein ABII22_01820 [Candidatus Micrarchaeota archaeon]
MSDKTMHFDEDMPFPWPHMKGQKNAPREDKKEIKEEKEVPAEKKPEEKQPEKQEPKKEQTLEEKNERPVSIFYPISLLIAIIVTALFAYVPPVYDLVLVGGLISGFIASTLIRKTNPNLVDFKNCFAIFATVAILGTAAYAALQWHALTAFNVEFLKEISITITNVPTFIIGAFIGTKIVK